MMLMLMTTTMMMMTKERKVVKTAFLGVLQAILLSFQRDPQKTFVPSDARAQALVNDLNNIYSII